MNGQQSRGRVADAIGDAVAETVVKLEAGYTVASREKLYRCLSRFAHDIDATFGTEQGESTKAGEIFRVLALELYPFNVDVPS